MSLSSSHRGDTARSGPKSLYFLLISVLTCRRRQLDSDRARVSAGGGSCASVRSSLSGFRGSAARANHRLLCVWKARCLVLPYIAADLLRLHYVTQPLLQGRGPSGERAQARAQGLEKPALVWCLETRGLAVGAASLGESKCASLDLGAPLRSCRGKFSVFQVSQGRGTGGGEINNWPPTGPLIDVGTTLKKIGPTLEDITV